MWQSFTERARASILYAQEAAQTTRADFVGAEHILLGLLKDESCVAAQIVARFGHEPQTVRQEVIDRARTGTASQDAEPKLDVAAKKSLELAANESHKAGHHEINSGHMLLGLLSLGEKDKSWFWKTPPIPNLAGEVLGEFGIDLKSARGLIDEFLMVETQKPGGTLWQKFNEEVQRVMLHATEEAMTIGSAVTPIYLVLGIFREPKSTGAIALKKLGVDARKVRAQLEKKTSGQIQAPKLTPESTRVLELAREEAKQLQHDYIGTEHLLLAARQDEDVRAIFAALGIDESQIVEQVKRQLG